MEFHYVNVRIPEAFRGGALSLGASAEGRGKDAGALAEVLRMRECGFSLT